MEFTIYLTLSHTFGCGCRPGLLWRQLREAPTW